MAVPVDAGGLALARAERALGPAAPPGAVDLALPVAVGTGGSAVPTLSACEGTAFTPGVARTAEIGWTAVVD